MEMSYDLKIIQQAGPLCSNAAVRDEQISK